MMKWVTLGLALLVIVLVYLLFTMKGKERTVYLPDVTRENELKDSLNLITHAVRVLATQNDSIFQVNESQKVAYKSRNAILTREITVLRAQLNEVVAVDTGFLALEEAWRQKRVSDSTRIVEQDTTISQLTAINTDILLRNDAQVKIHTELMNVKAAEIAQLKQDVKKERRKKVLSQIGGAIAVGITVLLALN